MLCLVLCCLYSIMFFLYIHRIFSYSSEDIKYGWDFSFHSAPCIVLVSSKLLFSVRFILSLMLVAVFNLLEIFVYLC